MKFTPRLALLSLVLASLLHPAHAIPPPDALLSLWQSTLQFIGMISVFIAGAFLALKQFWAHYLIGWKRYAVLAGLISMGAGLGFWMLQPQSSVTPLAQAAPPAAPAANPIPTAPLITVAANVPTPATYVAPALPKGELLSVTDTIMREPDAYTRDWKLQTTTEMEAEAQTARELAKLPALTFDMIQSFTPQALSEVMQKQGQQLYLLDVREEYERTQFRINHQAEARYGDLVHDIMPTLPRDKVIMVLCHSGIRGYIAASTLKRAGYKHVAFLQGGLAAWNAAKLPVQGDVDYATRPNSLKVLNEKQFKSAAAVKVQIDTTAPVYKGVKNLLKFPYETASTPMLQALYKQTGKKPIALVCNSYGACFHSKNMEYVMKQAGQPFAGVYDASGQWLK